MASLSTKYVDSELLKALLTRIANMYNSLKSYTDDAVAGIDYTEYISDAEYDSATTTIYFKNTEGTVVSSIDASAFIIDGMLDSVELTSSNAEGTDGSFLHFIFNTASSKEEIYVDVTSLVDIYTAGNGIDITDNVISAVKSPDSEDYLTIDSTGIAVTGIAELAGRVTSISASVQQNAADIETLNSAVETLSETVSANISTADYYAALYDPDDTAPEPESTEGDIKVADCWEPCLVDCTDNTGTTTKAYPLQRLNWLRYEDGTYAPAIGITEDMRAQCDAELYLDAECTEKYCDAGAFDAARFYEDYGYGTPLYDADGNEIEHILRPWETTETKYSNVIANTVPLWLIDLVEGDSGKYVKGISRTGGKYDGINFTSWKLPCTGLFASPVTTVDGAARSFYFDYCYGDTNCLGDAGYAANCTLFYNDRSYPRSNDMNQGTTATRARANNADTSLSYPFAEGGDFALNVFTTCMELKAGSKYLIDPSMFGNGISPDDSCSSETTWLANGGCRDKLSSSDTWGYYTWSTSSHPIYHNASGSRASMSATLNYGRAKEPCCQSQIAFSLMQELGIAEGEEFEWADATWWWASAEGVDSVAEGRMNCRVYKKLSTTFTAYDADGAEAEFDVEVVLRMSLFEGMSLSGDVWGYWGGGYEAVMEVAYSDQIYGNPVKLYAQPDQTQFVYTSTYTITDGSAFSFEDSYTLLAEVENLAGSWTLRRQPYTPYKVSSGGSRNTGDCGYGYTSSLASTTVGYRQRMSCRRRGSATYSYCSPRFLIAHALASIADRSIAGSAQCLVEVQ